MSAVEIGSFVLVIARNDHDAHIWVGEVMGFALKRDTPIKAVWDRHKLLQDEPQRFWLVAPVNGGPEHIECPEIVCVPLPVRDWRSYATDLPGLLRIVITRTAIDAALSVPDSEVKP